MLIDFNEYAATVSRVKAALSCFDGSDVTLIEDDKGNKYLIRKVGENKETLTPIIFIEKMRLVEK